jgi:hypothetical protein
MPAPAAQWFYADRFKQVVLSKPFQAGLLRTGAACTTLGMNH